MANTANFLRRQSSRDMHQTTTAKTLDNLELKELKGRLVKSDRNTKASLYGATNPGFYSEDSPTTEQPTRTNIPQTIPAAIDEEENGSAPDKPEDERESWDSKIMFLLATIGYAVGLGNVWRFPYLAQKNGGGAFLVPYFIMLAIQGIPIFYLELAIGQRLRKGAIGVWHEVSPWLGGIGISSAIVSFIVALYYNTIIAWCLIYLFHSFESPLPWSECPKRFYKNNFTYDLEPECTISSPTQFYWYRSTLMSSPSVNDPVEFNFVMAASLIIAWSLVYLCMVQGLTSSGKIVYITALFPYVVLVIFFIRGITLHGASVGLAQFFTPRWEILADPVVWLEAGTQIFFSLGLAFGGLIAFSSYNPANNNCYRDAIIVSLTNCGTSVFAGTVVFSVIGFKATKTHEACLEQRETMTSKNSTDVLPVCDLQKELANSAAGTGLAFIIFTEAINQFPGSNFWAILFFLMLFTLGIDSQFGTLEGVVTSLMDMKLFPTLPKEAIIGGLSLSCCILSMVFAHGAGSYIFQLMDSFAGNYTLLIIAFFECIGISYIYGIKRFSDDIELMTGSRPRLYWLLCWKYISPIAMLTILTASFIQLFHEGSYYPAWDALTGTTKRMEWPHWCIVLAIILIFGSIMWIPVVALCRLIGITIVEDTESAWFPVAELREAHGLHPHEPTELERMLFCIQADGSEGMCCPTFGGPKEETLDDDD